MINTRYLQYYWSRGGKCILASLLLLLQLRAAAQEKTTLQVQNLTTLCKLYGYVRHFYPGDEAAAANWEQFLYYAARQTINTTTTRALRQQLQQLFGPLAPQLKIGTSAMPRPHKTPCAASTVYWQHLGYGSGFGQKIYMSRRVGRDTNAALFTPPARQPQHLQAFIHPQIKIVLPLQLRLCTNEASPAASRELLQLREAMQQNWPRPVNATDSLVRIVNVMITWNVMRHFYPYWDDVQEPADSLLHRALRKSMHDKTAYDFKQTLELMLAPLNDGHVTVVAASEARAGNYTAPVLLDWADGKVVADKLLPGIATDLQPGDIIENIDGTNAADWLQGLETYLSGSPQYKRRLALHAFFHGASGTAARLTIRRGDGTITVQQPRSLARYNENGRDIFFNFATRSSGPLDNGFYYLDLRNTTMEDIGRNMDTLRAAKGIICDLRGYPSFEMLSFLGHFLQQPDTAAHWLLTPRVSAPDYQQVTYLPKGLAIQPRTPFIEPARCCFLVNSNAVSLTECFLALIRHYKMGTIIGETSAGVNGNINLVRLPAGYYVYFTGMRVINPDGSRHHITGIQPDKTVRRSIDGIKQGRDEVLEKAIEYLRNPKPAAQQ